jgi:tetratricopeptide (TPR) repeat protein
MRLGRADEATAGLERLLDGAQGGSLARLQRALRAAERYRVWPTAARIHRMIVDHPDHEPTSETARRYAHALARADDLADADVVLRDALERDPEDIDLLREWAKVAGASGAWGEGVRRWEQLVQRTDGRLEDEDWAAIATAHRRVEDLAGAEEALRAGRERSPAPSVRLVVEDVACTLQRYRVSSEDARHTVKERLLDLERELLAVQEEQGETRAGLRAVGNLQLVLRQWEAALRTWETFEDRYPDAIEEATKKQVRARTQLAKEIEARVALPLGDPGRLEAGDGLEHYHLAVDALRRGGPTASASTATEQRRLAKHYGRAVSNEVADIAELRLAAGDRVAGLRLLEAATLVRGYDVDQAASLRPLLSDLAGLVLRFAPDPGDGDDDLDDPDASDDELADADAAAASASIPASTRHASMVEQQEPTGLPTTLPSRPVVLASGFLYSGSGAAFDYLRQLPGTDDPFASGELWCLKKHHNFMTVLEAAGRTDVDVCRAAFRAVLTNVFGFDQTSLPLLGFYGDDPARLGAFADVVRRYLYDVHEAASAADAGRRRVALHRALTSFLDGAIALRVPEGRHALLNNAVPAYVLHEQLDLFPEARAVAVIRDPRDQFVSQRLESPYSRSADDFISMMAGRYEGFARALDDPLLAPRIVTVCFEDLVSHEHVRKAIAEHVGLTHQETAADGDRVFDAAASQRNVGIHRAFADLAEVDRVQAALGATFDGLAARATVSP